MRRLNNEEARVLCESHLSIGEIRYAVYVVFCLIQVTVMSCPNQLRYVIFSFG